VPRVQPATAGEKHHCPDDEQRGATERIHKLEFARRRLNIPPRSEPLGAKTKSNEAPGPEKKGTRPDIVRFLGAAGTAVTRRVVEE
jgi:hypothetical protein